MVSRSLVLVTVTLMFAISFVVTAYARTHSVLGQAAHVSLSTKLPISSQPPLVLSDAERVKLYDMLGSYGRTVGISSESFSQVRAFSVTPEDRLYIVPGLEGVCLVLGNGAVCGDPVAAQQIGLLRIDPNTGVVVGGGITDNSVKQITESVNNTSTVVHVQDGTYVIDESAGLQVPLTQPLRPDIAATVG